MFGRDYRKTPRKCNVGRWAREMGLVNRRVAVAQDQVVDAPPERGDELLLGNIHGAHNRMIAACCTDLVGDRDIDGEMPHPI
jgi:hypothetical protein